MAPIQYLFILFALFAISRVILRFRDKKISWGEFGFWITIWLCATLLSFYPSMFSVWSDFFGVGRPIDLVIYVAIIVLFYLMFRLYIKIDQLERNITKLVRAIAIEKKK